MLKKLYFNAYISLRKVNVYGFKVFFKSFLYEIYYSIKSNDFSFFNYEDDIKIDIDEFESKKKYSVPNIPTPFYFLKIIKDYLVENRINNFNFIDLGCGKGRRLRFFDKEFKANWIGLDYNKKFIILNKNNFKKKNYYFNVLDLNSSKKVNSLIFKKKELDLKKNIIFISNSISPESILKILPIFKKKLNFFLFIMINQRDINLFRKYNLKTSFQFRHKSRNINIFEI